MATAIVQKIIFLDDDIYGLLNKLQINLLVYIGMGESCGIATAKLVIISKLAKFYKKNF